MELAPINMAEVLYGQHPKLGDGLICTAVSLAGVLFNFVVMPSLDLLLGKDLHSRTEVRMLHSGEVPDWCYRLLQSLLASKGQLHQGTGRCCSLWCPQRCQRCTLRAV